MPEAHTPKSNLHGGNSPEHHCEMSTAFLPDPLEAGVAIIPLWTPPDSRRIQRLLLTPVHVEL